MKIEIDPSLISSFREIMNNTKDVSVKKKLNQIESELTKTVKDYVIDAVSDRHYIVVEDEEKANKIIKALELIKEGKVTDAFVVMGL